MLMNILVLGRQSGRNTMSPPANGPVTIPAYARWYGDSESGGREPEPTAVNPSTIFRIIAEDSGIWVPTDYDVDGASGRSLAGSFAAYQADTIPGNPMIWMQESGNQNLDGQRTASEFGATFQAAWEAIHTDWPLSLKLYETANSFRREAEAWRNWDPYNEELLSRIATLAGMGIDIRLLDVDARIKALVTELTYDVVCFPDGHANQFHFQGIGNFMIALEGFRAIGHSMGDLNHSGINLNSGHKSAAIAVITG